MTLQSKVTYLRSVLALSCCTHAFVNSILTRVYFAPVRATYIAALYSAFCLNTRVVQLVHLSLRSPANPEVRYPLLFASRLVYSCLDSILRLSSICPSLVCSHLPSLAFARRSHPLGRLPINVTEVSQPVWRGSPSGWRGRGVLVLTPLA